MGSEEGECVPEDAWRGFVRSHMAAHGAARAQDVYKLLHQACFGPGHIISDASSARRYLAQEWAATPPDASVPLVEPIDPQGRMARLHIGRAKAEGVAMEAVADAFLESARRMPPGADFGRLWGVARELVIGDPDIAKLDALASSGSPPPIHHSRELSEAERPHYRVMLASLAPRPGNGRARG